VFGTLGIQPSGVRRENVLLLFTSNLSGSIIGLVFVASLERW
jgi:hypothetical protein